MTDRNQGDANAASRRAIIGGVGGGLMAAPALLGAMPASAQQSGQQANQRANQRSSSGSGGAPSLEDPRQAYPRPPFPRQEQEWPGLASRMQPRPDHGEDSYRGSGKLTGRRALITGGDSGIGRAAAIAYAREGADVAINYLEAEESDAREVVELIRQAGRKAVAIPGNIQEEAFCRQLVDRARQELGGLDILVNNAGRQTAQPSIGEISTEQFDNTFKANIYALFWITKAALPHMPAGSTIINTASVVAFDPPKMLLDYSMTKSAIITFTQALAKQVAEQGIRVNAVAPGPYWTPLQPSGGQPTDALTEFGSQVPLGRPGQPAEIAPVYVMLASGEYSFASGGVFGSTGGTAGP
ncbi:SDR family oxidoreductase [Roseomonas frigidaquae]|uniref:SDR family oxidoreductase n=1 Tax=Falsiroseomonas frigidaquae TaxID=487318 RepID=A0ABX1ET99_9PROT|nr:SDR family oxidoreductase [Falsiroseomonas frigidaquae]NKE43768.1 SDR family oxidoreductase [Falsiroseomonas frigidaquae]